MAVKRHVGGLSCSIMSEAQRAEFAHCGTVESATVITDRYAGQSRGPGVVEMAPAEDAQNAVGKLNGRLLDGRTLTVQPANPPGARSGDAGGPGGGRPAPGGGGARRTPRW